MYQLWLIFINIVGFKIFQSYKRLKKLAVIKLLECSRVNCYRMRAKHYNESQFFIFYQTIWLPDRIPITSGLTGSQQETRQPHSGRPAGKKGGALKPLALPPLDLPLPKNPPTHNNIHLPGAKTLLGAPEVTGFSRTKLVWKLCFTKKTNPPLKQ